MKNFIVICLLSPLSSISCFGQYSESLLKKAEDGSILSQMELAKCYIDGNGIDQSQLEALKWYEKAANKNNIAAMVACGDLLCDEWNIDLEPDYVRGIAWYRKAASKGDQKAKEFLEKFKIVKEEISHECPFDWLPCDNELAMYSILKENEVLINKEHENKNPIATYYLAILSYVNKEYSKTVNYLSEIYPLVMDENNFYEDILDNQKNNTPIGATIAAKVFSLLGWCYEHGQGVKMDYIKAAEYYLSEFDYSAFGMSMIPKVRGAYCFKKAGLYENFIDEANSQGIYTVGGGYSTHYTVPCLQLELAEMYRTGDGVTKNLKKTLEIYESIVDKRKGVLDVVMGWYPEIRSYPDIGRAAYRAYLMYKKGEGCQADEVMAKLYFEIALQYGDKNAWYENQNK